MGIRTTAFHGIHNKKGRRDVELVFEPEAERFVELIGDRDSLIYSVDNGKAFADRARQVLGFLAQDETIQSAPFDCVAFFCHGWRSGMEFGFNRANAKKLATAITDISTESVVVPLYLCSTGEGADFGSVSFADSLRDELCRAGAVDCRVMAHKTVGHSTRNPNALFFDGMGSPVGGTGGYPVVGQKTELWRKWIKLLQAKDSNARFLFPFMRLGDIHAAILDGHIG